MKMEIKTKSTTLVLDENGYKLVGGTSEDMKAIENALDAIVIYSTKVDGFSRGDAVELLGKENVTIQYELEVKRILRRAGLMETGGNK